MEGWVQGAYFLTEQFQEQEGLEEKSRGNHAAANLQETLAPHHSAMTGRLTDRLRHQHSCRKE
ncbi:hypothetical protein EYF80_038075 [Liparis tanakae]|uniref:Uncharacterized protein n=1 Tax=Liparis tanakae TaxID=230148 RepID=A0A4Z2GEX5_9TELE|nr:hypothetical protein EYF80_038075 [Liparis tanakae]